LVKDKGTSPTETSKLAYFGTSEGKSVLSFMKWENNSKLVFDRDLDSSDESCLIAVHAHMRVG